MPKADPNRLVHCKKLQKELPGLEKPPFPTEFGQFLFENVSAEAWELWLQESVRYINTYSVVLSSPEGIEFMLKQLRIWLGIEEGTLAQTAWTPPDQSEDSA